MGLRKRGDSTMTATLISSLLARFVDEEGLTAIQRLVEPLDMTTGDIISQGAAPRAVCLLSHSTVEILLETAVRAAMPSDTTAGGWRNGLSDRCKCGRNSEGDTSSLRCLNSNRSISSASKRRAKSGGTLHVFSGSHFGASAGSNQSISKK